MPQPRVEFLWWEECPSWGRALADLRAAMKERGLDPEAVEVKRIETLADAERESFVGSPTIRVDGEDVDRSGAGQTPALTCRVYRRGDGRISPLPDPEDLRAALTRAGDRAD